jgi:tRNA(fMet)-specific endonuclease VapC
MRLAVDTNAAIDFLRSNRPDPTPILGARKVLLPLPVMGELYAGAFASARVSENLRLVEELTSKWILLLPDAETAHIYGRVRAATGRATFVNEGVLNDFWIAALCIQHDVPLVTNDRDFDSVEGLRTIYW